MHRLLVLTIISFGLNLCAFTPPAEFIIAEMAKQCISGPIHLTGMMHEGAQAFFTLSTLRNDGLFMVSKSPVLALSSPPQPAASAEQKIDLFVVNHLISCQGNTAKKLSEYLTAQGIDLKKVSHGFFNFDPVYIIGADSADVKSPQILIDKRNFLPVKEKTAGREIVLEHWKDTFGSPNKKLPSSVTVVTGGKAVKWVFSSGYDARPTVK